MKKALIAWLIARFSENTSKVGLGVLITGAWNLYELLSSTPHPSGDAITGPVLMILFGLIAFVTHDAGILKTLKLPDKS